ncbi:hypothetical protein WG68_18780 [Arsukibacterium ikkense]|uniref:Uncharacterized protein n=2 Tax=Arsukibacterium ikkense TaxID=336831 RepID=A0A0M2UZ28_9GAMM|nr:hypothetical protein WG68_18780 [Arsukibacterium ikkense]
MGTRLTQTDTIISVVAPHLQQPVADFVAKLAARGYQAGDRVSANFYENGYSTAAILLIVAMIESMLQRDRYFLLKSKPNMKLNEVPVKYLKETLRYRRHSHVRELFELRNALAHNHMWEVEYTLPAAGGRTYRKSKLMPGSHHLKALPGTNARIPRTRIVKFNLLPARVDRTDLVKALDVCNHAFAHLYKKEQRPVRFLDDIIVCGKRHIPFKQLAEFLRNEL